jgi:osmotically-inducible protein OsmY
MMSSTTLIDRLPQISSDERLAQRLADTLQAQHGPSRIRLRVEVRDGIAILRGTANSFYQKQLWLHKTKHFDGVEGVVDHIEVALPPMP